jgi:hypothetical protein
MAMPAKGILQARFRMVDGMVSKLQGCAERSRKAGDQEWADEFEQAAEALSDLAFRLELEIDDPPAQEAGKEGDDAIRT